MRNRRGIAGRAVYHSQEMRGRLVIAKVNVDENPGISMRYGIQSIPTMMVVRDGKIVDQWAGAYPEALMRSRILKHL